MAHEEDETLARLNADAGGAQDSRAAARPDADASANAPWQPGADARQGVGQDPAAQRQPGAEQQAREQKAAAAEALAAAVAAQAEKAAASDGDPAGPLPIEDGVGLGVDIVEIARMKRILERSPRFKERVYTEEERIYCEKNANPAVHYAMRFAAKEAVLKALGTGFSCGIAPADVEVERNAAGRPLAVLHRKAAAVAAELGVREIPISLSYTHNEAVACAMAITNDSIKAAEERKDPMEELSKQFKEARTMLDDLPVRDASAAAAEGPEAASETEGLQAGESGSEHAIAPDSSSSAALDSPTDAVPESGDGDA